MQSLSDLHSQLAQGDGINVLYDDKVHNQGRHWQSKERPSGVQIELSNDSFTIKKMIVEAPITDPRNPNKVLPHPKPTKQLVEVPLNNAHHNIVHATPSAPPRCDAIVNKESRMLGSAQRKPATTEPLAHYGRAPSLLRWE